MKRPARVILGGLALVVVAAALGVIAWLARPGGVYTDGAAIRVPVAGAPVRSILWEPAHPIDGPINSPDHEYEPRLALDGQTLYFVRGKAGHNADIYASTRTPSGWSEPQPLPFNTPDDELGPAPSADGRSLYFYSNRPGGLGGYDLYVARRDADNGEWHEPENLGPSVNTEYNEYSPAPSPDNTRLYFASNRPRAGERPEAAPALWPATIRESRAGHDYDLFVAPLANDHPGLAEPLTSLNTSANEGTPAVSPFGDFLYFSSDRAGGIGGFDLWRCRLINNQPQSPENLGSAINSPYDDLDPATSMGGFAIHFSSDRPLTTAPPGDYNLFTSTSREVFRDADQTDWAGLWSLIGRKLRWLLLSLLALLALLWLMKGARGRRLSILARCLLASLAIHAAIMFMLNFWKVAGAMGQYFGHPGSRQVHLVSSSGGIDSLAGQIRAESATGEISLPSDTTITAPVSLSAPAHHEIQVALAPSTPTISAEIDPSAREAAPASSAPALAPPPIPSQAVHLPSVAVASSASEAAAHLPTTPSALIAPSPSASAPNLSASPSTQPSRITPAILAAPETRDAATVTTTAPTATPTPIASPAPASIALPSTPAATTTTEPGSTIAAAPAPSPAAPITPSSPSSSAALASASITPPVAVAPAGSLATDATPTRDADPRISPSPASSAGAPASSDIAVALPAGSPSPAALAAEPRAQLGDAGRAAAPAAPIPTVHSAVPSPSLGAPASNPAIRGSLAGAPTTEVSDARAAEPEPVPGAAGGFSQSIADAPALSLKLPSDTTAALSSANGSSKAPSEAASDFATNTAAPSRVAPRLNAQGVDPHAGTPGPSTAAAAPQLGSMLAGGESGARDASTTVSPSSASQLQPLDQPELAVRVPSAEPGGATSGRASTQASSTETRAASAGLPTTGPRAPAPPLPIHAAAGSPRAPTAAPINALSLAAPGPDSREPADAPTAAAQAQPEPPGATFFGLAASGKRFAYICDISGSMHKLVGDTDQRRIDVLRDELAKSLTGLAPDTRFFVCLFSDDAAILGDSVQWNDATDDAKSWARQRMARVRPDGDTRPVDAFRTVLSLDPKPDAIYFMTDGEFSNSFVRDILRLNEQYHIPIHCITFVSRRGERAMQLIASESGGCYLHVDGGGGD